MEKIGRTHSGTFHACDVVCAALLLMYSVVKTIKRGGVPEKNDIVFDFGEKYNPSNYEFDHHQKNKPIRENGIPYSSAGLIWLWIRNEYRLFNKIWEQIDYHLEEIDAIENGYLMKKGYGRNNFNLIISSMVPIVGSSNENIDKAFMEAVTFTSKWLSSMISYYSDLNCYSEIVTKALKNISENGTLILDTQGTYYNNWVDLIYQLDKSKEVRYVVYKHILDEIWKVQPIPKKLKSNKFHLNFPKHILGKSSIELKNIVPGVMYVSSDGSIAETKDLESATELIKYSIANSNKK